MSWLQNAVIYHIFIDRFAGYDPAVNWQSGQRMGGNLRGIIQKIDYIRSLGVNTVWISPFYASSAYHGYENTDYYAVDPHLGTEADLRELIDLAHANGMKIIADFVPNHVSHLHPYFQDALKHKNSKYRDWFLFSRWPDAYESFYSIFPSMPKLNYSNPEVMEYAIGAGRKWLGAGLDGFRIDHVIGMSNAALKGLFGTLKREFPNSAFFGEAAMLNTDGETASKPDFISVRSVRIPKKRQLWLLGVRGLEKLQHTYAGILDGTLDFFAANQFARFAEGKLGLDNLKRKLQRHAATYPSDFTLVYFLDNHDLNRFLFLAGNNTAKLLEAAGVQFSLPGAKVIYYGTEIGMTQTARINAPGSNDSQTRQPMRWDETTWDHQLLASYKQLIAEHTRY